MTRGTLTLALLGCLATGAIALPASAQDGQCQKLQTTYQKEMNSAGSLKSKAAQRAVEQGSKTLSKLGIQLSSSGNTEQAIQKGALAATSPADAGGDHDPAPVSQHSSAGDDVAGMQAGLGLVRMIRPRSGA